jgi:hypothetical protein
LIFIPSNDPCEDAVQIKIGVQKIQRRLKEKKHNKGLLEMLFKTYEKRAPLVVFLKNISGLVFKQNERQSLTLSTRK